MNDCDHESDVDKQYEPPPLSESAGNSDES